MDVIEISYLVFYVGAMASRAPYALAARRMQVRVSEKSWQDSVLVAISGIGIMGLPLMAIFTDVLDDFSVGLPIWMKISGLLMFASAVILHAWTHYVLKAYWSPTLEIKERHKLIVSGPYRYVRHPMYCAFFLWAFSQGLMLANYVVLLAGMVSFSLLYFSRESRSESARWPDAPRQEGTPERSSSGRLVLSTPGGKALCMKAQSLPGCSLFH